MKCEAVLLAAGLGTRMKSRLPKVLHPLAGVPMVDWSIEACNQATRKKPYLVVGPESEEVQRQADEKCIFIEQTERLGTGHAVMQVRESLEGKTDLVLIAHADMPLLRSDTFERLITHQSGSSGPLTILTAEVQESRGFGRVKRDATGRIQGIIEELHATPQERAIRELNVGAYVFRADWLWKNLPKLPLSPKGEYYLTDMVSLAVEQDQTIESVSVTSLDEVIGVNTREHLAEAEHAVRMRIIRRWMEEGVTIIDPATTYIGLDVQIGQDTVILPNTHFEGITNIGEDCRIGPNSIIRDSVVGNCSHIEASVVEGATIEEEVEIGPFAHLRQGAHLCRGVHMGNFGEVKNSRLEAGVKLGHFSYIGDAHIGENTNIGAGTITCNFDGKNKHHTEIGADVFIGSDTMLVAPLKIGRGARTGAGSVVTKNVPDWSLAAGVPARVIRKLDNDD
ncbi:MAG: bifunctional UDP-N-acetylglucosamine diphosphorylase/glucosamine-1-phosphate N-acetyltransferase GlmU [Anaerolineales bacterium]|nr:bifunctional UDP-N-acetylglucosamine diphosphorylase/glucosamine-1-phosphate N-acetyltransferase GlmU [Anaerolineales bacterium]